MKIIKYISKVFCILLLVVSIQAIFSPAFAQVELPRYISQPDSCVQNHNNGNSDNGDPKNKAFRSSLKCPATIDDLQTLLLRVFGIINIVIGIAMLFGIIRAGFLYVTSTGVPEKVANAGKSLRFAILGFIGVGIAYIVLVTIGTIIIGSDGNRPNFLESNKIVFNFLQFKQN